MVRHLALIFMECKCKQNNKITKAKPLSHVSRLLLLTKKIGRTQLLCSFDWRPASASIWFGMYSLLTSYPPYQSWSYSYELNAIWLVRLNKVEGSKILREHTPSIKETWAGCNQSDRLIHAFSFDIWSQFGSIIFTYYQCLKSCYYTHRMILVS